MVFVEGIFLLLGNIKEKVVRGYSLLRENIFQWLPGVDAILENEEIKKFRNLPRTLVTEVIREILSGYRRKLREEAGHFENQKTLKAAIISDIIRQIEKKSRPVLGPVVNATGVVLHTNLGRAVLSKEARRFVEMVAGGYSNLEMDLEKGTRGSRYAHVESLLLKLTGAEACLVVNNNAAAVLLALDTLAKDRESIVSRGELVEIGGAFRIPDVMERSGSRLVEVGTTNKTYVKDYEKAITSETGLLLKVHTSNFRVMGFTHEATLPELVQLGRKYQIPLMNDLGSGCLFDLKAAGIGEEPTVQQAVAAGTDIITFSGDKLLGGPQAGIIVGKEKYVEKMKENPLTRALRIDKMTIAALEATLRSYLDQERAAQEIPTIEMLTRPEEILQKQSQSLKDLLAEAAGGCLELKVEPGFSQVGGGSLPTVQLPTWLVLVRSEKKSVDSLAASLRDGQPPVLAYIREDWLVFDPRTLLEGQESLLAGAVKSLVEESKCSALL